MLRISQTCAGHIIGSGVLLALAGCGEHVSPTAIASVAVTPSTASLNVGAQLTVTAQVKNAQGSVVTGASIAYTSSDTAKATVTTSGVVSAIAPGAVTITAASGSHSGHADLTLNPIEDDWLTYGHDGHRTAASWASLGGPLKLAWHYVPTGAPSHSVLQVLYPLGRTDLVVLRAELQTNFGYGVTPGADRVSTSGQHVWTYMVGSDADFGDWSSILGNYLVINDDGLRYVNLATGASAHGGGVDIWGETLTD